MSIVRLKRSGFQFGWVSLWPEVTRESTLVLRNLLIENFIKTGTSLQNVLAVTKYLVKNTFNQKCTALLMNLDQILRKKILKWFSPKLT